MANLYINENFPLAIATRLRELGHDVLTVMEAGKANQQISDLEVLQYAISLSRAVVTFNKRDFVGLHRNNPTHAGIVVCTFGSDTQAIAGRIHDTIRLFDTLQNELIRIYKPNISKET